jgi:MFS family permease
MLFVLDLNWLPGVFVGGWVSNTYGRRMCVFVMSIYALGSASVVISSTTQAQIQAGRALHCKCTTHDPTSGAETDYFIL